MINDYIHDTGDIAHACNSFLFNLRKCKFPQLSYRYAIGNAILLQHHVAKRNCLSMSM